MKKYNFTADEFNAMLGFDEDNVKHSDRYNFLREKFGYMDDEQFDEIYSSFYDGSTGVLRNTTKRVKDKEAEIINFILTMIASSNSPISFSDAYYSNKKPECPSDYYLRDRAQKIIDALEKTHKVEGLRVIRIMTQGTCHIKLYEIR